MYRVRTGSHPPVYVKQFPVPRKHLELIEETVEKMVEDGTVVPRPEDTPSGWNIPFFTVPKPNGGRRPVADMRPINKIIDRFVWPVPNTFHTLQAVTGASWFSCIDLHSGYHQVIVDPEDRCKLCFTAGGVAYMYKRLPMGVIDAPSFFCYVMYTVLGDLVFKGVIIYIDDILIYSKTFEEHLVLVEAVLERLQRFGLTLSKKKCRWFRHKVEFLGHVLDERG